MNHAEYLVDLVDKTGATTGTKKRQDINKQADLYHTVFVMLHTPDDRLILSKIPKRKDLPNLYAEKLGPTVATILRHNETPDAAGLRAVKNELNIDDAQLTHLGSTYAVLPDGHKKYMSVYVGTRPPPNDFSRKDIESLTLFSQAELAKAMQANKEQFSLTFLAIWQKYQEALLA